MISKQAVVGTFTDGAKAKYTPQMKRITPQYLVGM